MNFRVISVSIFVSIWIAFAAIGASAQTIGLYFDEDGDRPYYNPIDITYPMQIDLFCVAKNLDKNTGIDGWEMKIGWSDSLIVSLSELYGQAINVGNYPNFIVGLSSSIGTGTGVALLAKFSVVAFGPGELFLEEFEFPSIPGAEVPLYLRSDTIGAFGLEYGGNGSPSAAVGAIISPANSTVLTTKSRISKLEFREEGLFGLVDDQKSWIEIPHRVPGQPLEMTPEQEDAIRLVPVLINEEARKNQGRGVILFEEDFEGYVADSGVPFVAMSGQQKKFNSGTWEENYDCRVFWGVLSDSDNGETNKYAFGSAAVGCDCTEWYPQGVGGTWEEYRREGFWSGVASDLRITSSHLIPIENRTYRWAFDCKTEGFWNDGDYLGVTMRWGEDGNNDIYEIAEIDWEAPAGWLPSQYNHTFLNLPDDSPDATVSFYFSSDYESSDTGGAYIDNVIISSHNNDLSIFSANTTNSEAVTPPNPIPFRVEIYNAGTDESGDFVLGHNFHGVFVDDDWGTPFDFTEVAVPSIPSNGTGVVDFFIPFPEQEKSFSDNIERELYLKVDANNDVPEYNEENNEPNSIPIVWESFNPPVILVHGILGGGLTKNFSSIYGEDFKTNIFTSIFHPERIMRTTNTDWEFDTQAMFTPSAYSERGFLRDMVLGPIQQTILWGLGSIAVSAYVPGLAGMWDPLIENLTDTQATDGTYLLPEEDPPNFEHDQDVFLFNYDWRLDLNPDRIQNLNGSTNSYTRLDSLVNWIKDFHPGAERLTVVSHSMGGLLVQAYLRKNPNNHGVFRWITLGTPFQGSELGMASLFGKGGLSLLAGGLKVPVNMADQFQEFVSAWEYLPTPLFDAEAPAYQEWGGPKPFNVIPPSWVCGLGCTRAPFPTSPNTSMDFIKGADDNNPPPLSGWYHNDDAREKSEQYQDLYMDNESGHRITGVDTWLIAGDGKSTIRGVNRYQKEEAIWDPEVLPEWLISTTHDVAFGPGDEQVGIWSATTANVEDPHVLFAPGVTHIDLLRSTGVGNFVGDLIRGRDLTSYYNTVVYPSPQSGSSESPWVIKWETDAAVWVDKSSEKSGVYDGMPVSLDLIDRANGTLLIGLSHVTPPEGDNYIGPLSVTTVYDSRFSYMEFDGSVFIYSDCMDQMDLRLIIRPHPQVFDTAQANPAVMAREKDLDIEAILGHLKIFESNQGFNWVFPDDNSWADFIKFTSVGEHGFRAFVDFSIQNGDIPSGTLTLIVDGDGDGLEDPGGHITGILEEDSPAPVMVDIVKGSPNPFNAATNIYWEITGGNATELQIHDLSGKLVRVFNLNGGNRGAEFFDGRNSRGVSLASGVYLVTVVDGSNSSRAMSKITIVK